MKPRYGHGLAPHDGLTQIVNKNRQIYSTHLLNSLGFKESIWKIKKQEDVTSDKDPAWNNGYLPGLDIIMLYTLMAHYRPNKYIEVGSGNSTKVAYKAKQEQNLETTIISIDPMPRAEIDKLSDEIIRTPFENSNFDLIGQLEKGDILFIDNSHRILPNSDSMVFFMEVLPYLKKGVIVHIHDIYIPYDYPQFMCERSYSEQYGLAMNLMANDSRYKTIMPCYFVSEDEELSNILTPIWDNANLHGVERHGGSYWIEINE